VGILCFLVKKGKVFPRCFAIPEWIYLGMPNVSPLGGLGMISNIVCKCVWNTNENYGVY